MTRGEKAPAVLTLLSRLHCPLRDLLLEDG